MAHSDGPDFEHPWATSLLVVAGVVAGAALLLFTRLDATDLWAPDEPRYAEIAEELGARPDGAAGLVVLRLNGEAYTQKPPLYFWLAALAGTAQGHVSERAARLPSAVAGFATVVLTLALGARLLGGRRGAVGAALLLTSWEFAHLARRAQLDVLLGFWITAALASFWLLDRGSARRSALLALFHAALGLAVLTKGPVGVLVPALIVAVYLTWERRLGALRGLAPVWALALSLGPGLAWLAASTALAPDGYFDAAVVDNLFGRFFSGTSHDRPFYYYFYAFPVLFLPWTPLWLLAGRLGGERLASGSDPQRARAWRFLLTWVGVTFVFFSLSAGKRGLYLLPAFPAAALLCADAVLTALERSPIPRSVTRSLGVVAAAAAVLGLASPAVGAAQGVDVSPMLATALAACSAGGWFGWRAAERTRAPALARLGTVIATTLSIELVVFAGYFPALDPEKSPRVIAQAAAELTAPDEPVGLLSKRALAGGLNYYGGRRIVELATVDDVPGFLAAGGRVLVIKARHLDRVRAHGAFETHARARTGRRELLVVRAAAVPEPRDE